MAKTDEKPKADESKPKKAAAPLDIGKVVGVLVQAEKRATRDSKKTEDVNRAAALRAVAIDCLRLTGKLVALAQ